MQHPAPHPLTPSPAFESLPPHPLSAPLPSYAHPQQPAAPRPRLKRSHGSTSTLPPSSADSPSPRLAPALPVVAPAPTPADAPAAPWSSVGGAHLRTRSSSSTLDPIKEWPHAELDGTAPVASQPQPVPVSQPGGLGLQLDGAAGGVWASPGRDEDDEGRRTAKRRRVAPDHEAFGRMSLASPLGVTSPGLPSPTAPPTLPQNSGGYLPSVPIGANAQQLPTPPSIVSSSRAPALTPLHVPSAAAPPSLPAGSPLPLHLQQRDVRSPLSSSPTLPSASLPAAPPTSPVASAHGGARAPNGGAGQLPTVPWSQSAFFPAAPPAAASDSSRPAADADAEEEDDEIEMRPAAGSWDLDPHRVYVASLSDDDEDCDPPHAQGQGHEPLAVNPLALRAAKSAGGLPEKLVERLRREAEKAQRGSLILYRGSEKSGGEGGSLEGRRERDEREERRRESWREFERAREMEERGHDADGEEAVDDGGMDVDMEL
ncbi:hypothetical protein Rhopal_005373-T1 [Rhodotorula paludigena]|uniref:Proteophosphoglycan ppg4 n=1 Tax=Rhodotorula paludigena TaxID=86838 RepID=A0AAV5GQ91_9BASI|nr:hypothetical protein Rhopal_005373-T1 [Rhodotorula paludigena]